MNPDYKRILYERGRDRLATLLGMVDRKIVSCILYTQTSIHHLYRHTYIHTYIHTIHTYKYSYIGYPEGGGKDAATLWLLTNYGNPLHAMLHNRTSIVIIYECMYVPCVHYPNIVCMYVGRLVCEPDALWSEYEEKKLSRTGDSCLVHFCGHFMKHLCA